MECLKNIAEFAPSNLESMISVREKQIISMALSKAEHTQLVLFAAAAGETISEEVYPGDTLYYLLSGNATVQADKQHVLSSGDVLALAAGSCHSLSFSGDTKYLQLTIESLQD